MKLIDKIIGKDEDTNIEETAEKNPEPARPTEAPAQQPNQQGSADKVVNFNNKVKTKTQLKVMVVEPASFDDAQQVADHIRNHKPVVVNFENTNSEIAKRIIDFISGTTYALSGDIKKVGKNVFMCAPSNVSVNFSEELKKQTNTNSSSMPWDD